MDSMRNVLVRNRIDSLVRLVTKTCNDKFALEEARELVPIACLVQDNIAILEEGDYHDNLLPVLTEWFKNEFFTWFAPPKCKDCNCGIDFYGSSSNVEGLMVEKYRCTEENCNFTYDFIRHNDPAILLKTRQGRCGEWANCFMLILRSLDYDTRTVHDSTDHVWNEVWSEAKQMWIHVDPCEGEVDNPLLYELGWSKKLEYCIAYSQYEAVDVTPRYTRDLKATLERRNSCDESWLTRYLADITLKLLSNAPSELKAQILYRRNKDLTMISELATKPRILDDMSRFKPRKTGAIQWRIARGEYSPHLKPHKVIKVEISPQDCINKDNQELYHLKYDSDRDTYYSSSERLNATKNWSSLIYESENIDHKYEPDWKTSYLARYESCPYEEVGKVQWRLDLASLADVEWSRLEVIATCQLYENTSIDFQLRASDEETESGSKPVSVDLKLNENNVIERARLERTKVIDLTAMLSGGLAGDSSAWQKPQLFRQARSQGVRNHSLHIRII